MAAIEERCNELQKGLAYVLEQSRNGTSPYAHPGINDQVGRLLQDMIQHWTNSDPSSPFTPDATYQPEVIQLVIDSGFVTPHPEYPQQLQCNYV
jgi:hypothetical protein